MNIISNLNWNEGTWQSLHGQYYHWFLFVFFSFFSMSVILSVIVCCDKVTRLLKLKWTLFHVSWWWSVDKIFASKSHTQVSIFISWNKSCNIYAHILETITYLLTLLTYLFCHFVTSFAVIKIAECIYLSCFLDLFKGRTLWFFLK